LNSVQLAFLMKDLVEADVDRFSVLVSGFGVGFGLVHTTLVVVSGVSGCFRVGG
jgi:hypothetical protein